MWVIDRQLLTAAYTAAAAAGPFAAQVLLRWSLQKGFAPLPKSASPARQAENAALFDWRLSDAAMMAVIGSWQAGTSIMGAKLNCDWPRAQAWPTCIVSWGVEV
jgi:diketogulonate reductase-like aldo/keto reductase